MTCLFIVVLLLTTRLLYKAFSAKPLNDPFNGVPEEDDIDDEVGQCRLTLSNPRLKRLELSA